MTIFIDLDGTILDVSARYYAIYTDILAGLGLPRLGLEEYWRAKRRKTPEKEILALTGAEDGFDLYRQRWPDLIESPAYLQLDCLQKGAIRTLEKLAKTERPVLATLRKSRPTLLQQLANLGLRDYFGEVINNSAGKVSGPIKLRILEKYLAGRQQNCHIFISDTDGDIRVGKSLGCLTIAVLNGMRTRELLLEAGPDYLVDSLADLYDVDLLGP